MMGERLTKEWTVDAAGAFGPNGAKGLIGEQFVFNTIKSWGWECELFEHDQSKQVAGVDIRFKSPSWANWYTADIKNNMTNVGSIKIETDANGWLYRPIKRSDRIWHCNPDTGWMAWYARKDMQDYIACQNLQDTGLVTILAKDNTQFITRRKVAT